MSPAREKPENVFEDEEDPALDFVRSKPAAAGGSKPRERKPKTRRNDGQSNRGGRDDVPRYQQMRPIGARLWHDQANDLTNLRRQLTNARQDKTERITDNTLLRVAVDVLLAMGHQLKGDTEDQLREAALASLRDEVRDTAPTRKSRTA